MSRFAPLSVRKDVHLHSFDVAVPSTLEEMAVDVGAGSGVAVAVAVDGPVL